jgi:hypothetical protein
MLNMTASPWGWLMDSVGEHASIIPRALQEGGSMPEFLNYDFSPLLVGFTIAAIILAIAGIGGRIK